MGIRRLLLSLMLLLLSACQKIEPQVLLLGSDGRERPLYPAITNPELGNISGGRFDEVKSVDGYQLQGRVSFVPSHDNVVSIKGYELRGTVSF